MTTSRQKILAHLKKTRPASAREIARALKLSAPNVRHHLSVLTSDGRVEMTTLHNREGRGRPEKMYSLSQAVLGDNLAALAKALLDVSGSGLDFEAVAKRLMNENQFIGQPVNKRLQLLIERLNVMHYRAHWEAGAGGPRVIFGRCPYESLPVSHPELCKMDAALLKNALGRDAAMLKKNEPSSVGICPFIFQTG
jgi:predicted ArsR family transcriptional regulator